MQNLGLKIGAVSIFTNKLTNLQRRDEELNQKRSFKVIMTVLYTLGGKC